ncbi:MAG TPA: DUF1998 domain-containing protein [Ktedonobacteraceae bacterium]|nr:DUF1998 domain-containing protein [Ktedonobacteraceae bacterium]
MTITRKRHHVGELRPSQVLYTYGIGSVVDLPFISAMVMGLDDWEHPQPVTIHEERLLQSVRALLGQQVTRLLAPPEAREPAPGSYNPFDESTLVGVPVAAFPRWMLCPRCRTLASLDSGLFQLKADVYRPDRTRFVHANCSSAGSPPAVVPARFLVACKNGHLDDFPWLTFVHGGVPCQARLKLRELGVTGEAADIQVLCETCGKQKRMSEAFGIEGRQNLPPCSGRHPHLRSYDKARCQEQSRAILLGASNSWFPLLLSTLAVPSAGDPLSQLVEEHWRLLSNTLNQQNIALLRSIGELEQFAAYADEAVWQEVEAQRRAAAAGESEGQGAKPVSLKAPEWGVLTHPQTAPVARDFKVTAVAPPDGFEQAIKQVALVERLREVRALVGFTRIEAPGDFSEMDEVPEARRAPLSRRPPTWIPAAEVRGEGIFLEFREEALSAWLERRELRLYERSFYEAHVQWRTARRVAEPALGYPGARYVLLHSLAHALMRQLTLECGYTAASIRERIYALPPEHDDGPMAGILLYTAAPDSEGTLGGLVGLGTPTLLGHHLDGTLERMASCTSDPLCAEHHCVQDHSLHEAACHACLFLPETSCERGNKYLDRSVLVPTVDRAHLAFFSGGM